MNSKKNPTNKIFSKCRILLIFSILCFIGFIVGLFSFSIRPAESITYLLLFVLFLFLYFKEVHRQECNSVTVELGKTIASKASAGVPSVQQSISKSSASPSPINANCITENFHITGVSHYLENIEELALENSDYDLTKKEIVDSFLYDEKIFKYDFFITDAKLVPEPENPYDPNAIKVLFNGVLVGYVKRGSCSHVKKLLASGKIKRIDGEITGGKYKLVYYDDESDSYQTEHDEYSYRVTVSISYEK